MEISAFGPAKAIKGNFCRAESEISNVVDYNSSHGTDILQPQSLACQVLADTSFFPCLSFKIYNLSALLPAFPAIPVKLQLVAGNFKISLCPGHMGMHVFKRTILQRNSLMASQAQGIMGMAAPV